jgi:hypothetical protein
MLTAANSVPDSSFVTFVSGLAVVSTKPSKIDGANVYVAVPSAAQGQTYVFITNSDVEGTFTDRAVLYGPAIVEGTV